MLKRRTESGESEKPAKRIVPLAECLAKTTEAAEGLHVEGLSVEQHSQISGLVARELIRNFPDSLRDKLFPAGSDLLVSVHDVGKINPLFQEKIYRHLTGYKANTKPGLEDSQPELEKGLSWHWGVSYAALEDAAPFVKDIVGCHHGEKPSFKTPFKGDAIIGGREWQQLREELIVRMKDYFGRSWPEIEDDLRAGVLAGLTTVSDWIGSSVEFFPENEAALFDLVRSAVQKSGFVRPQIKKGLTFTDIFSGYQPRDIQKQFVEMVEGQGVYVLEELMGQGKTEAALMAAYKLLEQGVASGIYFALPTKLTSEKIYSRFNAFLNSVLAPEDPHRSLLLHGDSWIVETQLGEEGRPGFLWFNSRKRGLLAPFAVGTIDQAMMSVMNVKHGFVRTFGLAGKVVILDEVHTYDFYTGAIMDKMIHALRSLGCTVILLSATLSSQRKCGLLASETKPSDENTPQYYPLISKKTESGLQFSPAFSREAVTFAVRMETEVSLVFEEVRERAAQGEYILWIENSVKEAQDAYRILSAWGRENGIETGLIHSRFPVKERNEKEDYWVSLYGKEGAARRKESGKILVGTQVLEQSLDIDSDFLVSRLAPTDMLLQRIGRAWRHKILDEYRPEKAKRQILILMPQEKQVRDDPKQAFGVSGLVYSPYVLARSFEVWCKRKSVTVPDAMRGLIEETYSERSESEKLHYLKAEMKKEMTKLKRFADISMSSGFKTESDHHPTRYSELPSVDVLLLNQEPDRATGKIVLSDNRVIALVKDNYQQRKETARAIQSALISVSVRHAPEALPLGELNWLKPFVHVSLSDQERIRVAVVEPGGQIRGLAGRDASKDNELFYNPVLGYSYKKKKGRTNGKPF